LAALDELRRDEQVAIEREVKAPEGEHVRDEAHPPLKDIVVLDAATLEFEVPSEEVTGERGNPAEMTRRKALTELAESVFGEEENAATMGEGLGREAINALISRAIEAHARGREEEATAAYQRVIEAGAERPAVRFSLGLLYQERQRLGPAIAHFERAASDPDYALGSHFALGECYRAKGRIQDAVQHLIGALRAVDLGAVASELAGDLVTVYQHLAEDCLVSYDRGQAVRLADRLSALLTENGWEENLKRARERLDELTRGGPVVSLAEGLAIGGSGRILESLAVAQEHRRAGLFYTAMEDCHFALESSPNFLPTHWQLAEVALEMGKTDQAVEKFAVIADTYRVRGSAGRAAVTYERALQLAPMDTKVRARLIDLLADQDKVDQALTHYTKLAESHYHLAQMDRARETYQQALQLASRADDAREWKVQILERIGDIDMQRVDWSRASSVYEQIRNLAPGGESARFTLMELYYRQGRDRDAARELDGLLQAYREEGRSESVYAVLEKAVDRWPDAILLRARLAQAHLDAGDAERALEHLERLADLQLQAGREGEVKATVEAMIALDPTSADEYRELLERMETGNPPDRLAST
jgi:tetratricopeptide (TPR) repeat protein